MPICIVICTQRQICTLANLILYRLYIICEHKIFLTLQKSKQRQWGFCHRDSGGLLPRFPKIVWSKQVSTTCLVSETPVLGKFDPLNTAIGRIFIIWIVELQFFICLYPVANTFSFIYTQFFYFFSQIKKYIYLGVDFQKDFSKFKTILANEVIIAGPVGPAINIWLTRKGQPEICLKF